MGLVCGDFCGKTHDEVHEQVEAQREPIFGQEWAEFVAIFVGNLMAKSWTS